MQCISWHACLPYQAVHPESRAYCFLPCVPEVRMEPGTVVPNVGPLDLTALVCSSEKAPDQNSPGTTETLMKDVWLQVSCVGKSLGRSWASACPNQGQANIEAWVAIYRASRGGLGTCMNAARQLWRQPRLGLSHRRS